MAKKAREQKDYKGFKDLVKRVKTTAGQVKSANVVYIKNAGFVVYSKITEKVNKLIKEDAAFLVGVYAEGVTSDYLIEDFMFVIDQIAGRESKYENISEKLGS